MIEEILKEAREKMAKTVEKVRKDLAKIRTGRAHPDLLDHIRVDYYGSEVPLKRVASITVEDARTLAITPWEKQMVPVIEKALLEADLGITPQTAGQVIRVPFPPLTEERRQQLVKLARQEAEQGRIAIRNIRREALSELREAKKEGLLSEDEERRAEAQLQKLTDEFISKIDQLLAQKEKDLLTV